VDVAGLRRRRGEGGEPRGENGAGGEQEHCNQPPGNMAGGGRGQRPGAQARLGPDDHEAIVSALCPAERPDGQECLKAAPRQRPRGRRLSGDAGRNPLKSTQRRRGVQPSFDRVHLLPWLRGEALPD
jgi:hypothetical protein